MPATDAQAVNLYIESAVAQAKAEVCVLHIDGFHAEFSRRFNAWRDANAEAIARGRRQAEATNFSPDVSVQGFAVMNAQVLATLPADDRLRRCRELLSLFPEAKSS